MEGRVWRDACGGRRACDGGSGKWRAGRTRRVSLAAKRARLRLLSARGRMLAFRPARSVRAGTRRRRASESARTRGVETRRAARARAVVDGRREADAERSGPRALGVKKVYSLVKPPPEAPPENARAARRPARDAREKGRSIREMSSTHQSRPSPSIIHVESRSHARSSSGRLFGVTDEDWRRVSRKSRQTLAGKRAPRLARRPKTGHARSGHSPVGCGCRQRLALKGGRWIGVRESAAACAPAGPQTKRRPRKHRRSPP